MYGTKTFNVVKLGPYLRGYVKERISQASEDLQHKVSLLLRHTNFRFANFPVERRANGASTVRSDCRLVRTLRTFKLVGPGLTVWSAMYSLESFWQMEFMKYLQSGELRNKYELLHSHIHLAYILFHKLAHTFYDSQLHNVGQNRIIISQIQFLKWTTHKSSRFFWAVFSWSFDLSIRPWNTWRRF
jgi:hypothetical protein